MTGYRAWLRRAATGAAMMFAITGLGVASAEAHGGAIHTDAVAVEAEASGDVGVQHTARVFRSRSGCEYVLWSDHSTAQTIINRGSCNTIVYVRAFVCRSGACLTTEWRSGSRVATYNAPSGYTIRSSFHRLCGTCSTVRLNH